jgi:3D (Asp-Asp-Asp) domain-containing protein
MYVYCGEFKLTAYQFVSDTGYGDDVMVTAFAGGNPSGFEVSYGFAKDVELNGTGRTSKASSACRGDYIYSVSVNESTFTFRYKCGRGKPFYPPNVYYGRVVAADLTLFSLLDKLYIPEICNGYLCDNHDYNPNVIVRDEGGAIKGYRLDIFTGEGPGQRATNNTPALMWIYNHTYLGITTTYDGRGAVGPTPVYQPVYDWWEGLLLATLYCHNPIIPW